jgi:hypothetical protein
MYSKFFQDADLDSLEQQLDMFLAELEEVTGEITNIKMLQRNNDEVIVLVIYSCWKKL